MNNAQEILALVVDKLADIESEHAQFPNENSAEIRASHLLEHLLEEAPDHLQSDIRAVTAKFIEKHPRHCFVPVWLKKKVGCGGRRMKLIMPALKFVSADDAPDEWKDGRQLLAFGDYGPRAAVRGERNNLWAVVVWAAEWEVVTADGVCGDYNNETDVEFCPAWLAELPVNMEASEVTE